VIEKFKGAKNMEELGKFVEEKLESIRPGSRSAAGIKFPEPGATSFEITQSETPQAKDKDPEAGAVAGSKHNEKLAQQDTDAASAKDTKETLKATEVYDEPTKPKATPNPLGTSKPLSAEDFQKLVTTTQDPWFIKFYAPWCHHCQALAPVWNQMSKEMQGKLNIGEVNCEVEPHLCKDARVKAYPTMYYFRGGERVEYDGLRGLGDLISYANKALDVSAGVKDVDAETFRQMEETEEVIFVYFYDHATTREDFTALERLTLSLIGHAVLVKTQSKELADRYKISTWPRLIVSRDGRASYHTALAPKDMRDFRKVLTWMQSVWLPIVPELTASNAREIMDGRYVTLGMLSRENKDEFILSRRELKNAALEWMDKQTQAFQLERQEMRDAKQLRIEEAEDRNDQRALRAAKSIRITVSEDDKKQVSFAWVDAVFWERWIRNTYGIDVKTDGERVVINDEDVSPLSSSLPSPSLTISTRTAGTGT
jgi:protein disulfide-isomerase